jgi:hypothetical protein
MLRFPLIAGLALGLPGCAPSILYFGGSDPVAVPGTVPRDAQGNPVWAAIKPAPPGWEATRPDLAPPPQTAEGSKP